MWTSTTGDDPEIIPLIRVQTMEKATDGPPGLGTS
jgi:hypothetical protein